MVNFAEFIKQKEDKKILNQSFNEAFKNADADKGIQSIISVLKKKIPGLVAWKQPYDTLIGGKACKTYYCFQKKGYVFGLNIKKNEKNTEVYSIDFFKNLFQLLNDGKCKTLLSIYTMGTSSAYFIPIIAHVMNNHDFKLSEENAKSIASKKNEAREFILDNNVYSIYENIDDKLIDDIFFLKESSDVYDYKNSKLDELTQKKIKALNKEEGSPEKEEVKKAQDEYDKISQAIDNGAKTVKEIQLALKNDVIISIEPEPSIRKAENQLGNAEGRTNDAAEVEKIFKKMKHYINMIVKGLQPGLIISGGAGIGKTFTIKQELEKVHHLVPDRDYIRIAGYMTPGQFFKKLFEYKSPHKIVWVDDCDSVVNDETGANILKAALDSSDERIISYDTAHSGEKPSKKDNSTNGVPSRFKYEGNIIFTTNKPLKKLDDAFKNRTFIQDIHLNNSQVLGRVKGIMDDMSIANVSTLAKEKAYKFLDNLVKKEEGLDDCISIRTFMGCARIYQLSIDDPDMTEEEAQSMISEQMKNQSQKKDKK